MNRMSRFVGWRYAYVALLLVALLLGVSALLLSYNRTRTLTLNVGDLGDSPFVSAFYADEADLDYRYRWSTGHSQIEFIGAGSARPGYVVVRAQPLPQAQGTQAVTMSVSLNGVALYPPSGALTPQIKEYDFEALKDEAAPAPRAIDIPGAPYILAIDSSVSRSPGDSRLLGVKVDWVQLGQDGAGANLPPLWVVLWSMVFVAGLFGIPTFFGRPLAALLSFAASLFGVVLLFVLHEASPLYTAAYLPPIAAFIGVVGLVVWQRRRLLRWPKAIDMLGRRRTASLIMLAAMLVFAAVSLWAIPQVSWIGHADYAENANVARSLVEGHGLTVDYVAQFYKDYSGITHPAETWPLLQPILIAPFFALFGPNTWAAKLPNLFILLGLVWAVFVVASRLWDSRVGLLAGLLTLLHPYFFNTVLYPINDLAFTAIFFVLAWLVWRMAVFRIPYSVFRIPYLPILNNTKYALRTTHYALFIGVLAGLLIWSKPGGVALLAGLALWVGWVWWRRHRGVTRTRIPWRVLAIVGGAAAVVVLPLVVRSVLAFGKLYFSTESLDVWILRYWPYHEWEDIYKVYVGAADYPHPRWVVGGKFGYQNLLEAVAINFRWVWEKGIVGNPGGSEYIIGLVPLIGALVGLSGLTRRVAGLFGMVAFSIGLYGLFVLLYWHFEGRYFQVAIPWLFMLLAWGIFWVWDNIRKVVSDEYRVPSTEYRVPSTEYRVPSSEQDAPLPDSSLITHHSSLITRAGLLLLPVAVAALLWPSVSAIHDYLTYDTRPTSFTLAMDWLAKNSTASDVVMTRDPWELNWYTRRKAVMIPYEDLATIERVARQYGVTMLQLGGPADGVDVNSCPSDGASLDSSYPKGSRPSLGKLYCGYERAGFTLVYRNGDLTIYRLSGGR